MRHDLFFHLQNTSLASLPARLFVALLIVCMQFSLAMPTWADLLVVGDTDPTTVPDEAGDLGSSLTIGITDVGGMFFDGVNTETDEPVQTLITQDVIIGDEVNAIGAVVVDSLGALWEVDGDFTLGNDGYGTLDMFESGSVRIVDNNGDTFIGRERTGYGELTIDGLGTLFVAQDLFVGDEGVGKIIATNRGLLRSEVSLIGNDTANAAPRAPSAVHISGRGTRWSYGGTGAVSTATRLTIGGDTNGYGTLQISDEGAVLGNGSVVVNRLGHLQLQSGGSLQLLHSASSITNDGVISGDGFIGTGTLINAGIGIISNVGTSPLNREKLHIYGEVTNNSTIFSEGGHMKFDSLMTNNRELIARDAFMEFSGGLTNASSGDIVLGGDTTVHSLGVILSEGDIHVLADSEIAIVGDLQFSGSSIASFTVGDDAGTLDVIGSLSLDGMLEIDYSSGVFSQPGDTYQILGSTETIAGTFNNPGDQVTDDEGRVWDIIYNQTNVLVSATNTLVAPSSGDFNQDGMVDGSDFLTWQQGFGVGTTPAEGDANGDSMVDGADLAIWMAEFGNGVGPVSGVGVVPEPSSAVLALAGLMASMSRRRSREFFYARTQATRQNNVR